MKASVKKELLEKEKMHQVQLLATHYQRLEDLPLGVERDEVIREILRLRNAIFSINKQLTALEEEAET